MMHLLRLVCPYPQPQGLIIIDLLEYLPISMLISLPIHFDALFPTPHIFEEFFVLWLCGVQLSEFVTVKIWCYVEGSFDFLSANNKRSLYDAVISNTVDRGGAEDIFARGF